MERVGRWRAVRVRGEGGVVTAETAIVLPVLVVVLLAGLWAIGVVVANIRCVDAARDTARAVARGETPEAARAIGERAAPRGAEVTISQEGDDVQVAVQAVVRLDWTLLGDLRPIRVAGHATVRSEETGSQAGTP